jgi:hypothetical protein
MFQKPTLVLLVERTIAAAATKCMRLGMALTDVGIRRFCTGHIAKETHPKEDVPMEMGQDEDRQWANLYIWPLLYEPFVCKET